METNLFKIVFDVLTSNTLPTMTRGAQTQ